MYAFTNVPTERQEEQYRQSRDYGECQMAFQLVEISDRDRETNFKSTLSFMRLN